MTKHPTLKTVWQFVSLATFVNKPYRDNEKTIKIVDINNLFESIESFLIQKVKKFFGIKS